MKNILLKLLQQLQTAYPDTAFTVQLWDGARLQFGAGAPQFALTIRTPHAVRRTVLDGVLGFGEAYMNGDIEVDGDLQALFKFVTAPGYGGAQLSGWEALKFLFSAWLTQDTPAQAKQNVAHHYDLGNDFYRLWLDETLTYTCAYFKSPADDIHTAQRNKHEHICRKLRLQPGQTLVDIGCGWGAMLLYAARNYGVRGVGYTLSEAQYAYLQAEIQRQGLGDQVQVVLQDYRAATGQFDRFVSIGMFEQVGKPFIQTYFDTIKRLLKPGGVGVLHTIASRLSLPNNPWIEKYIFPGGYLPTLAELVSPMQTLDLNPYDIEDLRLHYGHTLDHWYQRFNAHRATVLKMYGEKFVRMWTLYLNGCAVTFKHGMSRLFQLTFINGLDNAQPMTRDYLYADPLPLANFKLLLTQTAPRL